MPRRPSRSPRASDQPGRSAWHGRTAWPAAALAALAGILGWTYAHLFAGEPHGLDNTAHLAEVTFLAHAFRTGDWGLWDPSGNSGFASGYYYQVLPQALTAAFSLVTRLAPLRSFQLGLVLPLLLVPVAAYRALRVMGAERAVATGAAIALPFAIGGRLMAGPGVDAARWGHGADGALLGGLYTQLWAFAALPLALAYAARWIETGRALAAAIGWGLFVGLCHPFAGIAAGAAVVAGTAWRMVARALRRDAATAGAPALLARLAVLGVALLAGSSCAWLPVMVDYAGFGGFPARVVDESGPGFTRLMGWIASGHLLDHGRLPALTILLAITLVFARARWLGWWWAAAGAYAMVLGVGPHLGKTEDDLFPAVRFLGPLQIALAIATGGGAVAAALRLGGGAEGARRRPPAWGQAAAWLLMVPLVVVVVGGARAQRERVKVMSDYAFLDRPEFLRVLATLPAAPPGRLQVAFGAECHWTLQLPYAYRGWPSVAVMGGSALQSSPNFVYAWELREADPALVARVFDAPILILRRNHAHKVATGTIAWRGETYQVREYTAPGLVGPVRVAGTLPASRRERRTAALRWLRSEMPLRDQVLASPGRASSPAADTTASTATPGGHAADITRGPSLIRARVTVDDDRAGPVTFAIRESWHPRWLATLDGARVPIRRITPDYLAVDVPRGTHALELRFNRPAWVWLLWLVGPALVLAAFLLDARHPRAPALAGGERAG